MHRCVRACRSHHCVDCEPVGTQSTPRSLSGNALGAGGGWTKFDPRQNLADHFIQSRLLGRCLSNRSTAILLLIIPAVICSVRWSNAKAAERGQGRGASFAARQREPLTPWRGQYAREWLWARHLSAHSLTTKASPFKKRDRRAALILNCASHHCHPGALSETARVEHRDLARTEGGGIS